MGIGILRRYHQDAQDSAQDTKEKQTTTNGEVVAEKADENSTKKKKGAK